jgi:serine/threonine protein kinase
VKKEIDIMKNIRNQNCIQLYEVIQDADENDEDASDKIYMILELAKYKEIMTWNSNSYDFVPNPILLVNSED